MRTGLMDYKEAMREARRTLESEKDRLTERMESLDGFMRMAETTEELLSQVEELSDENERLTKKSSQDEVLKALRTYVNVSKRKTLGKRAAVKVMIMELGNAISLTFPEDMIATLESLDDEQAEPKMVNVAGNYNDIHDNGSVNN